MEPSNNSIALAAMVRQLDSRYPKVETGYLSSRSKTGSPRNYENIVDVDLTKKVIQVCVVQVST